MSDVLLTQAEGDSLIAMEKVAAANQKIELPESGGKIEISLLAKNGNEVFALNYWRSRIILMKRSHTLRVHKVINLVRLDLEGPPHRNPDGTEIGPAHLHLYREGYHDKWAYPIPNNMFRNLNDTLKTLEDFMRYCNVVEFPLLTRSLFS